MKPISVSSYVAPLILTLSLTACGGGGSTTEVVAPTETPTVSISSGTEPKQLSFSWDEVAGATYYTLLKNPDGASGYTQVGDDITTTSVSDEVSVHLHDWNNASYIVQACNSAGCADSSAIDSTSHMLDAIGYFKASNSEADDRFGQSVALSADGTTMAVGAHLEDSDGSSEDNNDVYNSGAVYIFSKGVDGWSQEAYLKPATVADGAWSDLFGSVIALSDDGNTLVVSAPYGDGVDDSCSICGEFFVFVRTDGNWSQQAQIAAPTGTDKTWFPGALSISGDGNTIAAPAYGESGVGVTYIFTRSDSNWSQQARLLASNAESSDEFGGATALSYDGNTLAVSAVREDSDGSEEANNDAADSGAVYIFTRSNTSWSPQAYLKAGTPDTYDFFGNAVDLSADGNTLAVGAMYEDSATTTINGVETDNTADGAGAVYLFTRSDSTWNAPTYIKAPNAEAGDFFGLSLSLSSDGSLLAVGAYGEDTLANGVGSYTDDTGADGSGAAYLFRYSEGSWSLSQHIKASNTDASDDFGYKVALNADGETLAIAARTESSAATGINGDQSDNNAGSAGAVYLY